jgi:hypothetical protein
MLSPVAKHRKTSWTTNSIGKVLSTTCGHKCHAMMKMILVSTESLVQEPQVQNSCSDSVDSLS